MTTTERIGTDQIVKLADRYLVTSASQPGAWHEVKDGVCDCKGFQHRLYCRHADAVTQIERERMRDYYRENGWPRASFGEWY